MNSIIVKNISKQLNGEMCFAIFKDNDLIDVLISTENKYNTIEKLMKNIKNHKKYFIVCSHGIEELDTVNLIENFKGVIAPFFSKEVFGLLKKNKDFVVIDKFQQSLYFDKKIKEPNLNNIVSKNKLISIQGIKNIILTVIIIQFSKPKSCILCVDGRTIKLEDISKFEGKEITFCNNETLCEKDVFLLTLLKIKHIITPRVSNKIVEICDQNNIIVIET